MSRIETIEKEIEDLIMEDDNLSRQYKLINSIKGVGPRPQL
jgi:hypothetical protein